MVGFDRLLNTSGDCCYFDFIVNKGVLLVNVLSLFDGMSCGQIALNSIGLKPAKYYAAEIDKYAIKACLAVYPNTIQLGSVTEWQDWDINWSSIDIVSGGFPCQAWSMAGKQLGDKDERGMLFWTMLDIMKECKKHNPKVKFLIENVKMKKEFEEYITHHTEQALGEVCKTLINSALVSAQNRNRYYWTNWHVEQPEDKGILLKDIIDSKHTDIESKGWHEWFEKNKEFQVNKKYTQIANGKDKAITMTARQYASWNGNYLKVRPCQPRQYDENSLLHHAATAADINGNESIKRVYADSGKSPTLTTMQGGHREPKVLITGGAVRGRYNAEGKTEQKLEVRKDERSNAVTKVQKDSVVVENCNYRKLTPRECARLQTIPEDIIDTLLSSGISNSQLYKMFGNGWTIDVIAHIFSQMELPVQAVVRQLSLFDEVAA